MNVFDLEVNSDSSLFLFTGKTDKHPVLVASSLDGYFDCASAITFETEIYGLRKIHSSDYFMVGGKNCVYIVQLSAKGSLAEITAVKDLQIGLVQRIEIDGQNAYLLEKDGGKVCTVAFSKPLEKLL
jgi:hypothetical protein